MELTQLKITSRRIGLMAKLGLDTVESVLAYYPTRYELVQIKPVREWVQDSTIYAYAKLVKPVHLVRLPHGRSMAKLTLLIEEELFEATIFNRTWVRSIPLGKTISIQATYQGARRLLIQTYSYAEIQEGLIPVYPLKQGITQKDVQAVIKTCLKEVNQLESLVPARLEDRHQLISKAEAICQIHCPSSEQKLQQAIQRVKYEEFLVFQCVLQANQSAMAMVAKPAKHWDQSKVDQWISQLPYALTADQQLAIEACLADLASEKRMARLVQGDVGCGKTMVALACMYANYLAGFQSVLMAPTEILARQHVQTMQAQGWPVLLYVSSLKAKEKKEALAKMADNQPIMVVGTHALFQEQVQFGHLGLVIADEQQRFGVQQRADLVDKGKDVDFLMMSATPIPRTYAHFLYGDMELSEIHTMPPNRQPVLTQVIKGRSMKPILKEVMAALDAGRQLYVVTSSIEQEEMGQSAQSIYEGMKKTWQNRYKVALIHGRLKATEKEAIMADFLAGNINVLVSTTVIEVGIDVKNATWMVIYDAHRFGLSTLHQLRGRVARGEHQGHCFLLTTSQDKQALERLHALERMSDGFSITELDLKLRGPGDVLGVRQSGLPTFSLASLSEDKEMMEQCVQDAKEILSLEQDVRLLRVISQSMNQASRV